MPTDKTVRKTPNKLPRRTAAQNFASGTFWVFIAEALMFPTGLVTAGILTRNLGPDGYGVLTLVSVLVSWVELTITSIFARTAVKFVSDEDDWQPVGGAIAQLHLLIGSAATLALWVFAGPIAALLDVPSSVGYLRLFALDIPIFCLADAHRQILMGRELFQARAGASAVRWLVRLAIIAELVEFANWSIEGAILGSLGASIAELIVAVCASAFVPPLGLRVAATVWLRAAAVFICDESAAVRQARSIHAEDFGGYGGAGGGVWGSVESGPGSWHFCVVFFAAAAVYFE